MTALGLWTKQNMDRKMLQSEWPTYDREVTLTVHRSVGAVIA